MSPCGVSPISIPSPALPTAARFTGIWDSVLSDIKDTKSGALLFLLDLDQFKDHQ
jgi:hypothetical protein